MPDGRNPNGTFAVGNPGGPGRPRRVVEREYLAALADAVPLETWRKICKAAVDAAKAGDARARDWLARYLLGSEPLRLLDLAADEAGDFGAEAEIDLERRSRRSDRMFQQMSCPE